MSSKDSCTKIIFLAAIICSLFIPTADSNKGKLLSRKKRYVVFPEGSSFSIALCMTIHTLTPDNIFTEGLNWGISYDLPNESKPELQPFLQLRKDKIKANKYYEKDKYSNAMKDKYYNNYYKPEDTAWNNEGKYYPLARGKKYSKADQHYLERRHRRDLYNKIEVIINAMGFDGRSCILRALCEASQRLMPKGNSLVEEMTRIVFTLPLKRVFSFEPEEHHTYTNAHKAGHEGLNCVAMFPGCSFSLIDMALGKYNAPDSADRPQLPPYPPDIPALGSPDVSERVTGSVDTPVPRYSMK